MSAEAYEQGLKDGRVDALLEEHTARLNKINGSVERHAKSNEALARVVQLGFEKVATEMRTIQEEARVRETAVRVAAETLATENERRRTEDERLRQERADALEVPVRKWSLVATKANIAATLVSTCLGLSTIYFAFFH